MLSHQYPERMDQTAFYGVVTTINFTLPFPYNGTDNLVVQIDTVRAGSSCFSRYAT